MTGVETRTFDVTAFSIVPRQLMLKRFVELINYVYYFCPWNSAGGQCCKLLETYLSGIERHIRKKEAWFSSVKSRTCRIWRTIIVSLNRTKVFGWRRCNTCNSHRLRFSNSKKFLFLFNQRNISFVNDISLKTMRLGVLMWENLNKPCVSQLSKWKLCCDSLEILSILIG